MWDWNNHATPRHPNSLPILIAPMWDWNLIQFHRCGVGISMLGSTGYSRRAWAKDYFFVKRCKSGGERLSWRILINQAMQGPERPQVMTTSQYGELALGILPYSNCTNVGLKLFYWKFYWVREVHSNCTNVGLKWRWWMVKHNIDTHSNCTNVGLKCAMNNECEICIALILIAPMWDWNK